jgi:hypothetical protein
MMLNADAVTRIIALNLSQAVHAKLYIRVLVGSQDVRVNFAGTKGRASLKIKTCYGAV